MPGSIGPVTDMPRQMGSAALRTRLQNFGVQGCSVLNDEADTTAKAAAVTFAGKPPFRKWLRETVRATKREGDDVNHIEKVAASYDAVVAATTASVTGD